MGVEKGLSFDLGKNKDSIAQHNDYSMPIIKTTKIDNNIAWALWKIEEEESELMSAYPFDNTELGELHEIKVEARRKESLVARLALHHLLAAHGLDPIEIFKDDFGKPHLKGHTAQMSISHTKGYGAAALNLNGPIGIDIEHEREQIVKISKKFVHPDEHSWAENDLQKLTMIWSAKEALYKLHGRTQLIFADQLKVDNPNNSSSCKGSIIENGREQKYILYFGEHGDLISCLAY